jgi:hypothetical protein
MRAFRVLIFVFLIVAASVAGWWKWGMRSSPNPETIEFAGLDEAKQKEIWDAEHFTFEIETYVGKKLVSALRERDAEKLATFFRENFEGTVPGRNEPKSVEKSVITQREYTIDSHGSRSVDRRGITEFLIEGIKEIPDARQGRFRVLKIKRVAENEDADVWQLDVLLTVGGLSADEEPVAYDLHGEMRCRFSDDEDIVAGDIVESWTVDSQKIRKSRTMLMEEVTADVGLDRLPIVDNWSVGKKQVRQYRFQTAVEDYNGNGHLDIAVSTADDLQFLLEWNAETGKYEDVTTARGLPPSRFLTDNRVYLACWMDFDNDGHPDLILGETIYRNIDGKRFEPVENNGGLRFAYNPNGAVVADYDGDGLLDFYVLYQHSKGAGFDKPPSWVNDDETGAVNQLWRNRGDGTFEEVAHKAKATGGTRHSFAATWLFANDDHYPDLYVANDFARNSLLINRGDGTFENVADDSLVGDFATSMGVASGDINGDGTPELYVANMFSKMGRRIIAQVSAEDYPEGIYEQLLGSCAGNRLYSTDGGVRQYRELSEPMGINAVGWAYAPAFLDYDGDGQLDLYATAGFLSYERQKPDG